MLSQHEGFLLLLLPLFPFSPLSWLLSAFLLQHGSPLGHSLSGVPCPCSVALHPQSFRVTQPQHRSLKEASSFQQCAPGCVPRTTPTTHLLHFSSQPGTPHYHRQPHCYRQDPGTGDQERTSAVPPPEDGPKDEEAS